MLTIKSCSDAFLTLLSTQGLVPTYCSEWQAEGGGVSEASPEICSASFQLGEAAGGAQAWGLQVVPARHPTGPVEGEGLLRGRRAAFRKPG